MHPRRAAAPTGEPELSDTESPSIMMRGRPLRATKQFVDGTHRTVPPSETLARIAPHLKTAGITRMADVTGLDRIGISTVVAHRPNSPTLASAAGKGFTLAAAMASGAMEGIEIYHAENLRLPVVHVSYRDLQGRGAVIPSDQLLLAKGSLFSETRPESWVEGWDLVTQQPMWVPLLQVAMSNQFTSESHRWRTFQVGSNGLASGNVLIEALCAGLLEVIERDAIACRMPKTHAAFDAVRVRHDTLPMPRVLELLARLERAHVGCALYDQTCNTAVPVYMATIYDRADRNVGHYSGWGAHLDPEVAAIRAITEAVQSRLVYIAGSRDDFFRHDFLIHKMQDGAEIASHLANERGQVDASAVTSEATPTFEGDAAKLIEKLLAVGVRHVIVVDCSHDELDIPVVRVLVPGLEGASTLPFYTPGPRARAAAAARATA